MELKKKLNSNFVGIVMFLPTVIGCNEPYNLTLENEGNICESKIYQDASPCEKIVLVRDLKLMNVGHDCLLSFVYEMNKLTSTESSMVVGFGGIYYPSDSLFIHDLKQWETKLCEQGIPPRE